MKTNQAALIILDGWGHREDPTNNALATAHTPNFDRLWKQYPHTLLHASGLHVGLPDGQMGNSEIGHTVIGAGKAFDTDLVQIKKAIDNGEFFENEAFITAVNHVKQFNSQIHLITLLSDGGVHSHQDHLFAFLKLCKEAGLSKEQVVLHVFTDGRDTLPKTAKGYLQNLEAEISKAGVGVIASVGGRYYGMDRAENADRIEMVLNVMFKGEGKTFGLSDTQTVANIMDAHYDEDPTGKVDEYMEHYQIQHALGEKYLINENDAIVCLNFRADRMRQIVSEFLKKREDFNLCIVTMTQYADEFDTVIAFPPISIETTLAQEIAQAGLSQAHISESEKFPHVTFFMNGQRDVVQNLEHHVKVESRTDIKTHDEAPEMMAKEIVDACIEQLNNDVNFLVVNFPNADVVGHTGNIPAIVAAAEAVDKELGRLIEAIESRGGVAIVTADHGNAEMNIDEEGNKHTAHTINQVPCIITQEGLTLKDGGDISWLAPTILKLLGLEKPPVMTGEYLF